MKKYDWLDWLWVKHWSFHDKIYWRINCLVSTHLSGYENLVRTSNITAWCNMDRMALEQKVIYIPAMLLYAIFLYICDLFINFVMLLVHETRLISNTCTVVAHWMQFSNNPGLTPKSAISHKKSLHAQYWVNLYKIWTTNRSWRDLQNGRIKFYPPPI